MSKSQSSANEPEPVFDWLQLQEELHNAAATQESKKDKLKRKVIENPLVPIGCMTTVFALVYGLWCFRKGERRMSQNMMRLRVAAQGFTVASLVVGLGLAAIKKD